MADKKKGKFHDWMVRIAFAEAGSPDKGFEITGYDVDKKTKLALDKIMVVKEEKATEERVVTDKDTAIPEKPGMIKKAAGEKLQVMIIDDEPIVGRRLKPALTKYGFEVEVFVDPARARSRLNEKEFDIVVTDLRMEELDGLQILEHVMSTCENTRVILITGYGTVEVAREALSKGAFDFVSKPFKPKDLRTVINKAALSLGHKGII